MAVAHQLPDGLARVVEAISELICFGRSCTIGGNGGQKVRRGGRGTDRCDRRRGNGWGRGRLRLGIHGLVPKEPRACQAQQAQQNPQSPIHNFESVNNYLTKSSSKRGGKIGDRRSKLVVREQTNVPPSPISQLPTSISCFHYSPAAKC